MSFRKMDEHLGKVLGDSAYRYLGHSAYSSYSQFHDQQEYLNQSGNQSSRTSGLSGYSKHVDSDIKVKTLAASQKKEIMPNPGI